MDSRMCSVQKCVFSGREELNRHVRALNFSLGKSAVSDLDVPTTYHKCVS